MILEHIAIWTHKLELLRSFYEKYFDGQSNQKYVNPEKKFASYFLTFDSGSRLELMQMQGVPEVYRDIEQQFTGFIHMAFETASIAEVDALTGRLRQDGYRVIGEPRTTGDGYYESVVLDPDENRVEITYQLPQ